MAPQTTQPKSRFIAVVLNLRLREILFGEITLMPNDPSRFEKIAAKIGALIDDAASLEVITLDGTVELTNLYDTWDQIQTALGNADKNTQSIDCVVTAVAKAISPNGANIDSLLQSLSPNPPPPESDTPLFTAATAAVTEAKKTNAEAIATGKPAPITLASAAAMAILAANSAARKKAIDSASVHLVAATKIYIDADTVSFVASTANDSQIKLHQAAVESSLKARQAVIDFVASGIKTALKLP